MSSLTDDFIAIDTNVFEHILNPNINTNNHINELLETLASDEISLIVDRDKRIQNQYKNRISPILRKVSEKGNELLILRLWFVERINARKIVDVDHNSTLMNTIDSIMTNCETVDRIFVYVAFSDGRILITNDESDIVERRVPLKNKTKQLRRTLRPRSNDKSDILTSTEAHQQL